MGLSQRSVFFPARFAEISFEVGDLFLYIHVAPCNGLQRAVVHYATNQTRNTGANPFFFTKSALYIFKCIIHSA